MTYHSKRPTLIHCLFLGKTIKHTPEQVSPLFAGNFLNPADGHAEVIQLIDLHTNCMSTASYWNLTLHNEVERYTDLLRSVL